FSEQSSAYLGLTPKEPHQLRWHVSLSFVLGRLWQTVGHFARARQYYVHCLELDAASFSPLLTVRQIDACLQLGLLDVGQAQVEAARRWLQKAIKIAQTSLSTDWKGAVGDTARPAEFGLSELAAVVERASACSYALRYLATAIDRPGQWWWQ